MRAYFFCNYYLSSIQQGIQSAHVLAEMYLNTKAQRSIYDLRFTLEKWARDHKTIIVLNGGNSESVENIYNELVSIDIENRYPRAIFREDSISLNGAVTCCGIILPYNVYNFVEDETGNEVKNPEYWHRQELKQIIDRYSLAK